MVISSACWWEIGAGEPRTAIALAHRRGAPLKWFRHGFAPKTVVKWAWMASDQLCVEMKALK
jgi:hypothetical protein